LAIVYDISANVLIEAAAKELAKLKSIKAPEWAAFVKTGMSKDTVPAREDWWYVRAAAILRTIYTSRGPIGVQKLRVKYGGKKNRGHKPEAFFRASGKIIRVILQQLETENLIKKADIGVHKGRVIAPQGKSFLDKIASGLAGKKPKVEAAKASPQAE
jgi:small subunit ribosomal protein S19e